jgi:hypothetical protein
MLTPKARAENRAAALNKTVEKMSAAAKVQRRFSAGRPMNELRTIQESIWMAKSLDQQLRDAMKNEGLKPEDSSVLLCYLTPDLSMLFTEPYVDGQEHSLHAKLAGRCCIMVGLIFGVRERDPRVLKTRGNDNLWILGAKPFLTTKLVLTALKQRLDTTELGGN